MNVGISKAKKETQKFVTTVCFSECLTATWLVKLALVYCNRLKKNNN